MARFVLWTLFCSFLFVAPGFADQGSEAGDIVVPPREPAPMREEVVVIEERAVGAAPPAWLELESRGLGLGLGVQWGDGRLWVEGVERPVRMRGLGLFDFGASTGAMSGEVTGLERPEDLEGTYLAVEAGATAGAGGSWLRLQNDRGVVLTLRNRQQGGRLTLGPEGILLSLE